MAEPNKNGGITEDCLFKKPIESEVNFGSSLPEKKIFKPKNIHTMNESLPVCIKNLIINKLYDECSDNLDSKSFCTHDCGNTCKSYVDVIGDKVVISGKNCDCKENRKNEMLNYLQQPISFVENRGYDVECPEKVLTMKDLLTFAVQIAKGMVSS